MGEYILRPEDAPRDSKGAGADIGKLLQATALAAQLGKTVEEVLAFMGTSAPPSPMMPPPPPPMSKAELPKVSEVEEEVVEEEVKPKAKAKVKEVPSDGFFVTESLDVSEASEADLQKLSEAEQEEENNNWDGKIREGSKVKVIYQVNASKINWVGKKGKVVRIIGNEHAKVFEVEFSGRKIAKVRLNKKTGKLERGFENRPLRTTFSEDQLELDA